MTPREADVAFVLEPIEGVRALHRIVPGRPAAPHFDFAVELERGGRILAQVHYALLRVLTHDECARVFLFHTAAPGVIAESADPLHLADREREAARRRVPPPPPRVQIVPDPLPANAKGTVLVVDGDARTAAVVSEVLESPSLWKIVPDVDAAAELARACSFELILCDWSRAFGLDGLLAKLPLEVARRVLVLAAASERVEAHFRLQGSARILAKPLDAWRLRERLARAGAMHMFSVPDQVRLLAPEPPRRRLEHPPASAPFTALLVDLDEELHDALRSAFREEARHLMRRDPEEAAEVALSKPFHVVICSAKAALHPRSFLDAVAREDPAGADRAIVVAPSRDVSYVRHKLAQKRRKNTVLALPIDDALLQRELFRDRPALLARAAAAEVAATETARFPRVRYRRLAVLVVDDDQTTQIVFAAGPQFDAADVALATTTMEAFEHVVSRPTDVLVISATMRADGGEPFYRVLWRLSPELKSRTVIVAPHDAIPPSAPLSHPPRLYQRPLTRDAIARITRAFAQRTGPD